MQAWPKQEHHAFRQLTNQGFETYLPTMIPYVDNQPQAIRPMFPGYLFVRFNVATDRWQRIWNTYGVRKLFSFSAERPEPLRDGVVEAFMAEGRAGDGVIDSGAKPFGGLQLGDEVRVLGGPFTNFVGVLQMADNERVEVMLTLFGRQMPTPLARNMVEPI